MEDRVFVTAAVGPALTAGLDSDSVFYNVMGAVNYNVSEPFSGKFFGDLAMGSDSDSARFLNFGVGGGMRFAARNSNWDVNVHYTGLTVTNEGSLLSMVGLRGGVNF